MRYENAENAKSIANGRSELLLLNGNLF
jgi:hypothetical protein